MSAPSLAPDKDGVVRLRYRYLGGHEWTHEFKPEPARWWQSPTQAAASWAAAFAPFVEFLPVDSGAPAERRTDGGDAGG